MKTKKLNHLYFQFGPLTRGSFSCDEIARILAKDGLIVIDAETNRYTETPKMKSIQVLNEYIELLLKSAL